MSNNKQIMKLYTEEQVNKAMLLYIQGITRMDIFNKLTPIELPSDMLCVNCDESKPTHNICMDCIIKVGKQNIELPSDEEIKKEMGYDEFDPYDVAYFGGISYMRNKIQGGNK